jgi:hypothetical protein
MDERRIAVIYANGKKIEIPNVNKVIVAIRDKAAVQHQASVDVTVDNIIQLKRIIRRKV